MWTKRDNIIFIDVDGTLISEDFNEFLPFVEITCPFTKELIKLNPIQENIDLMKKLKDEGFSITVHSLGGSKWVVAVLAGLGITEESNIVDEVSGKPLAIVDDLDPNHWVRHRLFHGQEPRAGSNWLSAKSFDSFMDDLEDFQIPKKLVK